MSEASSVEQRLEFLEGQNDALKRSGLLLLVLVIVMGVTMIVQSRTSSSAVSTDGLIINNQGKPRAALTSMPNGHLGMVFYDYAGNLPPELQFGAIPSLDGFAVYDKQGRPRIMIGMDELDNPVLAVVSADGKTLFTAVEPAVPASSAAPSSVIPPAPKASPLGVSTPVALPTP